MRLPWWLTRFDAPCLHTMVADKPMQGHRGMSNDEFGMTHWLHFENRTSAFALPSAIAVMHEKHGIACDMMHGFDWSDWSGRRVGGTRPTGCRPRALTRRRDRAGANAATHPRRTGTHLEQEDGKKRWVQVVSESSANGA